MTARTASFASMAFAGLFCLITFGVQAQEERELQKLEQNMLVHLLGD